MKPLPSHYNGEEVDFLPRGGRWPVVDVQVVQQAYMYTGKFKLFSFWKRNSKEDQRLGCARTLAKPGGKEADPGCCTCMRKGDHQIKH